MIGSADHEMFSNTQTKPIKAFAKSLLLVTAELGA